MIARCVHPAPITGQTRPRGLRRTRATQGRLPVIDELDARLIDLLAAEPRVGMLEASRRLGVARGTVQARLDRLHARGVLTGYGPDVDPAAIGHGVTAFVTLEIRQVGGHDPVAARLAAGPGGVEAAASGRGLASCVRREPRRGGGQAPVAARRAATREVLDAHTITGSGD